MNKSAYKLALPALLLALFTSFNSLAQEYLMNSSTNGTTITTCSGTLYDSGGAEGNYENNEDFTITLCSAVEGNQIILHFIQYNLEQYSDWIKIFDGNSISSPVIVETHQSLIDQTITSSGSCMTIQFESDGSINFAGFAAEISCDIACQNYVISISNVVPGFVENDSLLVDVCLGEVVSLTATGSYPYNNNGYNQSDENISWNWSFVNGSYSEEISGVGLTSVDYVFLQQGGYLVNLRAIDSNGCIANIDELRIRTSLKPDFSGINELSSVCFGEEISLNGSFIPDTFAINLPCDNFEDFCTQDQVGVWQSKCFGITSPSKSAFIESINDIESICINMEHSYITDLRIVLECPSGQSISLFETEWAFDDVYFGLPNHMTDCLPGIGWDYCWNMNAVQLISENGYMGLSIPSGNYLPVDSFEELIGCPIDGEWCLKIMDSLSLDDGYVFDISINLADGITANCNCPWTYTNTFDTSPESTDIFWSGENVVQTSTLNAVAIPYNSGDYQYTFSVIDDWGCLSDTTLLVTVLEEDDTTCGFFCDTEVLTEMSGVINDGSGNDFLSQNNVNCSWLVAPTAKSEDIIVFNVNYMDIYENDTLRVYNGNNVDSPLIGEFTGGTEIPNSIQTNGPIAYLVFTTDDENRSPGWELVYQTVPTGSVINSLGEVSIYPNPSNGLFNISGLSEPVNLSVIDMSGRIVMEVNDFENSTLDISNLQSGMYFIKIEGDGNQMHKILKQ